MLWSILIYQLKYRGSATTMSNPFLSQTTILLLVSGPLIRDLLCEVLESAGYIVVVTGDLGKADNLSIGRGMPPGINTSMDNRWQDTSRPQA